LPRHPLFLPYLALAAVCLVWGTTYLGIRMALETFPPLELISIRFTLSGGILLLFAWARGLHVPKGRELRAACLSGLLVLGIGNGALVFAEVWVPSGLAGIIVTLSPFWMVGAEALLPGGEPLHWPTIGAMIVGLAGVSLLFTPDSGASLSPALLSGLLVLQIGMAGWCFGSIYQRRNAGRAHPAIAGGVQQLAAGVILAPFAAFLPQPAIHWSARGVGALWYLVIFGSIVGYSAYAYALDRLPVAIASVYPYVNAIVAVALGWLIYREPFGKREALSMGVIFVSVALVKRLSRKPAAPGASEAAAADSTV
jgi:drug/metabolite transporter (DMT)-like permease